MEAVLQKIYRRNDEEAAVLLEAQFVEEDVFSAHQLIKYMHNAVVYECERVIRLLHAKWPSIVDILEHDNQTPLHTAAQHGKISMIYLLNELGASSKKWFDMTYRTPMEVAIEKDNAAAIHALHAIGCDHSLLENAYTPTLMGAAVCRGSTEAIKALHQINPALLRPTATNLFVPLYNSVVNDPCDIEVLELLCQLDPTVIDISPVDGYTAMHHVHAYEHPGGFERFLILQRYGSEAHFMKCVEGRVPVRPNSTTYYKTSIDTYKRMQRIYYSRSLSEVLFFTLGADEIQTSRRI